MAETENEFLEEIQTAFLQEAADLVAAAEGAFLALEKDPSDAKEINQIFRLFHNLKGSAAAVNFNQLSALAHKVENLLVKIREKEIELSPEILELLLQSTDHVSRAIAELSKNRQADLDFSRPMQQIEVLLSRKADPLTPPPERSSISTEELLQKLPETLVLADENNREVLQALQSQLESILHTLPSSSPLHPHVRASVEQLKKIAGSANPKQEFDQASALIIQLLEQGANAPTSQKAGFDKELDTKLLHEFVSDAGGQLESIDTSLMLLEKDPTNAEAIDATFRGFHTIKSAAAIVHLDEIETLAHRLESLLQPIRDKKIALPPEIGSISLEATALIRQLLDLLIQGQPTTPLSAAVQALLGRLSPSSSSTPPSSAPTTAAHGQTGSTTAMVREPIKVDADRLDRLVDSIGELVISETMVAQAEDLKQLQAASILFKHLDRLTKITRNLQEIGLALRMVPFRQTFRKMTRIVRDLSKKLDKEIDFRISGEETEVDRTVAEKIGDPLVHMVRNAIDHGIEKTKEARLEAGKPITGRVDLRAFQKGGSIWIEIEDDGRGLDKDVLIRKAREKGLLAPDQTPSDQDAYHLIFAPGFSTAEKVTDVSGRGVGMDVVRKNIEELRGQVDIETTKGKGTLFRIRIPNTLAIIEGMVVRVGRERYVIPTQSVAMAVQPQPQNLIKASAGKQEMLDLHGEILPFFRLGRIYEIAEAIENPADGIVLIVEDNRRRLGVLVDDILDQQQFVIKNIGDLMKNVPGVSGGTIMPDGQVGLILDIGLLVQGLIQSKPVLNSSTIEMTRKES